jgi:integrase
MLLPAFGEEPLEAVTTTSIEQWLARLPQSPRTKTLGLVLLHGIFRRAKKVWLLDLGGRVRLEARPRRGATTSRCSPPRRSGRLCARRTTRRTPAFLTAAFTGLRLGELLALCWRDVDFGQSTIRVRASYSAGHLTTPKSGKVRAVPLAPDVASALAQLGRREHWTGDGDLVFAGAAGTYLDGSALRRRYKGALAVADLRSLRFHDLRHTFGTRMIAKADIRRVQEWMGHADMQTTMHYLQYAPRGEDAQLVAEAFRVGDASRPAQENAA